jgi:hypothetical protein
MTIVPACEPCAPPSPLAAVSLGPTCRRPSPSLRVARRRVRAAHGILARHTAMWPGFLISGFEFPVSHVLRCSATHRAGMMSAHAAWVTTAATAEASVGRTKTRS